MIIHKIINNNIVSSLDENHNEIILMGRGIAYQKSRGEVVQDEMIEKQFYLKNDKQNNRFLELIRIFQSMFLMLLMKLLILHGKDWIKS